MSLKPNKPSTFVGKRDEYAVRTWVYQVKQYLDLIQVGNQQVIEDATKISYAATFLSGTAAAWWYTLVATNSIPTSWEEFEKAIYQEFIPFDSVQRARDKLRRLSQKTSVSSYLSDFRNIALTIPGMNEEEKVDRFCQGLKPQVRLEVMKSGARTMNDASRIALNVDSALFGAGFLNFQTSQGNFGPTPMDIGNLEQRDKDRKNNGCFKCHKPGCRPWKCDPSKKRQARISNANAQMEQSSKSENE